mmetsp:Transcript_12298/g.25401  ORF Transcript_12298/g.25401 Transcript_12298/m.25401 type:complete len:252 (+) Transcript_12298:747-1502(+)
MALQQIHKGQKVRTIQAPLVQVFRWAVGRGHHHGATLKEYRKQLRQNKGVRNIRHLEFVQAQETYVFGKCQTHPVNRIVGEGRVHRKISSFLLEILLFQVVNRSVNLGQKVVKVKPPFSVHIGGFVKGVHEHRFSGSHLAMDVESSWYVQCGLFFFFLVESFIFWGFFIGFLLFGLKEDRIIVIDESLLESCQSICDTLLGTIRFEFSGSNQFFQGFQGGCFTNPCRSLLLHRQRHPTSKRRGARKSPLQS